MIARTRSRWRRTQVVAAVGAALTFAVAAPARGGAALEPLGSGDAMANVVRVGPTAGGLQVALTFGQSMADYLGGLGRAQSRVLDLGVLGLVLTTDSCKGDPPPLDPSLLPPTLIAENRAGTETQRSIYLGPPATGGSPLGGIGDQQVEAGDGPSGTATSTLASLEIPGLLRTGGGKAVASSGIIDGTTRFARAVSTMGELDLGGGIVRMEGLRWEVEQRSGENYPEDIEVASKFSIGRLVVAGQELPAPEIPAEVAEGLAQVNAALAPTGLSIEVPRFERDGDIVRLLPIALRINKSELGRQVVGPVLEAVQPVREPAVDVLLGIDCQVSAVLLVGDVAIGVAAGSGGLLLELGGVQAMTEGSEYANPFGDAMATFATAPPPAPPAAPPLGGGGATAAGVGAGGAPGGSSASLGGVGAGREEAPVEMASPSDLRDPTNASSSSPAPAVQVGLMALAAALAIAAADYARMRREQFVAPTEAAQ